jgi:purine-nucleoside phosphorylase
MLGFAGAVDPELKTGDLVLSSRYYVESPGEDYLPPDPEMRQNAIIAAANAGFPVHHLDSITVDGIISTPSAKAALGEQYPVGIVGMEDYWLALTAQAAGVSFVSVRAVLDTAQQHLPDYLPGLSQGRSLDMLRMVAMPWRVPPLFRLAYQARLAQQSLTRFAVSFVRQWESEGSDLALANVAVAQ